VLQKIKREYAVFKHRMLSETVHEVYASCRCICFYESVWEYFLYHKHISRAFMKAAAESENILGELWDMYLEDECLGGGYVGRN